MHLVGLTSRLHVRRRQIIQCQKAATIHYCNVYSLAFDINYSYMIKKLQIISNNGKTSLKIVKV